MCFAIKPLFGDDDSDDVGGSGSNARTLRLTSVHLTC